MRVPDTLLVVSFLTFAPLCPAAAVVEPRHVPLPQAAGQDPVPIPAGVVPPAPPIGTPPSPVLVLQVLLDRAGFSPGEIDGASGYNLRRALTGFQRERKLPETGRPSSAVMEALGAGTAGTVLTDYRITEADLAGPFVPEIPSDLIEQSALAALAYRTPLEMLGERFHASPMLLQRLNPGATFATLGEVIRVPNVPPPAPLAPRGTDGRPPIIVTVSKSLRTLRAVGEDGTHFLQAPVTVGSEHDPLPIGEWAITGLWPNPVFHYSPELFWDADPTHAKARIQPGPNNPVGVMWIDLTREHYGLHGTPEPSRVGHTESHGCVRLTNWDVLRLAAFVTKGTRVVFEE
jgi:lipoprotein-anchoring transpeptidase ErfK/SrfK